MLHSDGKRTCDKEIGKPGNWHTCGRKAVKEVPSKASSITLDYCERHGKGK